MRFLSIVSIASAAATVLISGSTQAQMTTRYRATVPGGMVIIGNTSGLDAAPFVPAPVVGTVGALGSGTDDDAADVFWRSNSPAVGQATASTSITVAQARSQAMLNLPSGASVIYARLYWSARQGTAGTPDLSATIGRQGVFAQSVTADFGADDPSDRYVSAGDVTSIVRANGAGAYEVSAVDSFNFVNASVPRHHIGWAMIVVYERDDDPFQEMTVIDGFHLVTLIAPFTTTVPRSSTFSSGPVSLGVVGFNGSDLQTGDGITINGGAISDALNPANNIFNCTRSRFGAGAYVAGDLPQLTGGPRSTALVEIDVIDVTAQASGAGDVTIQATTTNSSENYMVGALALAVPVDIGGMCPGDADGNGIVNFADISKVLTNFNLPCP